MFVKRYCPFQPGTQLRVRSRRYSVYHFGIAGQCLWDGSQEVVHSTKEFGGHRSTLADFADSLPPEPIRVPGAAGNEIITLSRAYSQIGRPHNLITGNCEQFANWAATGVAYSQQLQQIAVIALGVVATGLLLLLSRPQE